MDTMSKDLSVTEVTRRPQHPCGRVDVASGSCGSGSLRETFAADYADQVTRDWQEYQAAYNAHQPLCWHPPCANRHVRSLPARFLPEFLGCTA